MKKLNFLICAIFMTVTAFAQQTNLVMSTPNDGLEYTIMSVSPNGKWACGGIFDGVERGFLWNLNTGEIIHLSLQGTNSSAKGVSNDGVVSGAFETTEGTPNNRPILTYGVWKNGKWTALELENEDNGSKITLEGIAATISPNGEYIAGIAKSGKVFKPIVWENGKLNIVDDVEGSVYDISEDGQVLCGWTTHPTKKNRTSALWTRRPNGTYLKKCIDLYSPYAAGPFSVATGMSPNGKYVIACNTVYDIESGDSIRHDLDYFRSGFELFGVTNSGAAYGFIDNGEFPGGEEKKAVMITHDREIIDIREYLVQKGINLDKYPYVQSALSISEDENTYVLSAYDEYFVPCTLVVKLVADKHMTPVTLDARSLEGINGQVITWKEPLYTDKVVKGYNIYRNDEKLNTDIVTSNIYTDLNLEAGDYTYTVSAVYDDDVESAKSESLFVTVDNAQSKSPIMLRAYNSALNDARIIWEKPLSNLPALRYVSDNDAIYGLGGDQLNFECAILARASELKLYKDAGYKISQISFVPKSRQNSWTVNFYERGKYDQPIYTEVIPSDNFKYGMINYHTLKTPLEIPEGKDIVMSIYVDVTDFGGYDIIGMNTKKAHAGYSDLIRQDGESDFYSLYDQAMNSEYGAMEYNVRWIMGMHFAKGGNVNDVKQYIVTSNDVEVGKCTENKYRLTNLENGTYQFGVAAEYADGSISEPSNVKLDVVANEKICTAVVPTVTPGDSQATVEWETPAAKDASIITYAGNNPKGGVLARKDQDYTYRLACVYKGNELVPFEDYEITAFRFYPLSDAQFTFNLFEDDVEVASALSEKVTGYTCGIWNTIKLDKPVKIDRNKTYLLSIECADCTPKEAPMAMDDQPGYPGISDLFSINDGISYSSTFLEGGKDGNWMIGLKVESIEKHNLPVEGYNIYLNGDINNKEIVNENTYVLNNLAVGKYDVCVNPVYPSGIGEVEGDDVTFEITISGIEDVTETVFDVERNANQIKVNGGNVTAIAIYDINGSMVANSDSNVIDIANINDGIYVLNIKMNGKNISTKIAIRK